MKHIPVTDVDLSGSTTMVITIEDCEDVAIYLCASPGDVVNNYLKIVLAISENKVSISVKHHFLASTVNKVTL